MAQTKVLFIYTNITGAHEDTYSFGLASLVAITKERGFTSKVIIVNKDAEFAALYDQIDAWKPEVVALTAVTSQYKFVKDVAEETKRRRPETVVVCGGVHCTVVPESILETAAIDAFFIGESEYSFIEFLKKIENHQDYRDTDNLCYNDNGKVKINPLKPQIQDLDALPYMDKTTYPFKDTVSQYGFAPFMFSRGCPYLCSYCSNHAIANIYNLKANKPRYRSPEKCIREIEWVIRKFPFTKVIWSVDDTFGIDRKWREEFCKKYKERVKVKLALNLRVNIIDEDFIRLLKDTGCYRISFGVESGNDHIRNDVMKRHMSNEQIINAFALCKKYDLETNAYNIIGVPGETEETIWDTIRLNRTINPTTSGINIFYPYKGTELGDYAYKSGLVNEEMVKEFSRERRDTVLLFPEDFKRKLRYYHDNWPVIIYPYDIKLRAKWLLMKSPVLWESLRRIKRKIYQTFGWV